MSQLDPLIRQKLRSFSRRRRRLIVLRGILAAFAMLFFAMILVAAIDYASTAYFNVFLPKWSRYALSSVAYLAVLIVAWRQCLTQLLHAPDERGVARLIEHAEPRLREDLISAVELGSTKGDVFDSVQFRALLQQDVAIRMEGMKMTSLLPVGLIRRTIACAVVIIALVIIGIAVTGGQLDTLLRRALMPGANLANVSRTKVDVVEPKGGDKVVPQGSTQRVEILISGRRTNKAVLEMETEKGGAQVIDMQALGQDKATGLDKFAATVQVQREDVVYRIKAGDHLSRDYTFNAAERPYVTQFEKTFHYPKYSKLPDKTVAETDGGLVALEGTEVDLKLHTNQPVSLAELKIEQGNKSRTLPLTSGPDGSLSARIGLNTSGTYRVHLVSQKTGFENEFSPENELRAEPDLVPGIELTQPKADLILPNNELVDLAGQATDDLGLAKISQLIKINDGPWRETVLAKENLGKKAPVSQRWDLYDLNAKPGDLIVTKLVATDLKGNKGESRPLQITITAAGFEMRRMQAVESLRALNETVHALAASADALTKTGQKSREQIVGTDNADTRRQASMALASALGDFDAKFAQTWSTLATAVKDAPAGHMSAELVLLGRDLSRLNAIPARIIKTHTDLLTANPSLPTAKELISQAAEECNALASRARVAEQAMETFTTAEEAAVLSENGQVVAREQQRLMELAAASGNDVQKWQPLVSRMRVTLTQTKAMEDLLAPIATRTGSPLKGRAKDTITSLSKRRTKLENALAAGEPSAKLLLDPTMELTRSLKDYSRQFSDWHRELGWKPVELLQVLYKDVGPAYDQVAFLSRDLSVLRANKNLAPETLATLSDARWTARTDVFKGYGDLEEVRSNADNAWVSDVRTATAALEALHGMAPGADKAVLDEKFTVLDRALRVLESGHQLAEVLDGLNFLATNERWDIRSLAARTQSPRDWKWLESRLHGAPDEINKAKELLQKLTDAEQRNPIVKFVSFDTTAADPQQAKLEITTWGKMNPRDLKIGEMAADSDFKLIKVSGNPGGVATVTFVNQKTNAEWTVKLGETAGGGTRSFAANKAFGDALNILWKIPGLPAFRQLGAEMDQRNNQDRLPVSEKADAEVLAGQVKLALELLRKPMEEARHLLETVSPKISELAQALAKEQKDLDEKAEEQAKKAEEQKPEEAKAEAQKQLAEQKQLDQKLDTLKDLIRAEANQQNILDKEQRELMRDADDALALLKDPPPAAEQALQDASNDPQAQQKADLQRAQEQQKKIENALNQIAKHFDAVEQNKPLAETRAALREAEKELNTKEELDQQFAHAQMLAEMAQKDAASLLKELEAKLPQNPLMQKELSDITKDALAAAEQKLTQAAGQEKNVANDVNKQAEKDQAATKADAQQAQNAQAPQPAQTAAEAAKEAADAAKAAQQAAQQAGQQASQAANDQARQQANAAEKKAEEAKRAAREAAAAAEQMAKATDANQVAQAAQQAAQKAAQAAAAAQEAANDAKQAENAAQQGAQKGDNHQPQNQQTAQSSNQAAQQAEKAAQAAQKAQAMAQQAAQQAQAVAQNNQQQQNNTAQKNAAQQQAANAAQAAKKAADAAKAAQQAAQNAEQQANAATNQSAAQQADAAGNEAAQAAQEAQAAADAAQKAADSGTPQQAAQAAQQAAQKAGEAAQAADKAANAAQQAQNSAQQAAQQPGEHQGQNQQAAQQAGQAQQQAQQAAQQARQAQAMAQQAANASQQAAQQAAQQNQQQLANAAAQQQPIGQNAADAAADLQRAGRHEMRLGNDAGAQLQQLGDQVANTAQTDVPAAQEALNKAQQAAQAQAPVNQAATELAQNLAALQNAQRGVPPTGQQANAQTPNDAPQNQNGQPQTPTGQQNGQTPAGQQANAQTPAGQQTPAGPQTPAGDAAATPPPANDAPASPAEQAAMARALDALDQQLHQPANGQQAQPGQQAGQQPAQPGQPGQPENGQPGQPENGQPGQPNAGQAAMAQAAQAAANAMRQARAQQSMEQGVPDAAKGQAIRDKSEHGALVDGEAGAYKLDATAQGLKKGEWGKLPKKLADQLTKGQQEAVAGDYRQAVETYYKVIAERAKKQ